MNDIEKTQLILDIEFVLGSNPYRGGTEATFYRSGPNYRELLIRALEVLKKD